MAERHGRVDIAFNNAGISPPDDDSILDTGLDAWERVLRVNTTSVYLCCKYAIPHMRRQGKGSIINTASFVALMGAATSQIAYTASKGGVLAMTRELGVQFAREGIRVNALCPGPVATPLLLELFAKDPERAARRLVHVPMGRFAEPEEIAAAVAFLASDDASFMTGAHVRGRRRHHRRLRHAAVGMSMRPLIGISAYVEPADWAVWRRACAAVLVPEAYVRAVNARGGRAVVLPPDEPDADVLAVLDGLRAGRRRRRRPGAVRAGA